MNIVLLANNVLLYCLENTSNIEPPSLPSKSRAFGYIEIWGASTNALTSVDYVRPKTISSYLYTIIAHQTLLLLPICISKEKWTNRKLRLSYSSLPQSVTSLDYVQPWFGRPTVISILTILAEVLALKHSSTNSQSSLSEHRSVINFDLVPSW